MDSQDEDLELRASELGVSAEQIEPTPNNNPLDDLIRENSEDVATVNGMPVDELQESLKAVSSAFNVPIEELQAWIDRPIDTRSPEVISQFRQDHGGRRRTFGEEYMAWECSEYVRFEQAIRAQAEADGLELSEAIERIAMQDEPFYSTVSANLTAAQCTPKYPVPAERLEPLSNQFRNLQQRSQALVDLLEFHRMLGRDIFMAMTSATPEYELNIILLTQARALHQLLTTTQADPHDWVEDIRTNTNLSVQAAISMMLDSQERTLRRLEEVLELPESLVGPQLKLLAMRHAIMEQVRGYTKLDDEWGGYRGRTFDPGFIHQVVTQTHFAFMHLLQAGQAPDEVSPCPGSDGTVCVSLCFQNRKVEIDFDSDSQLISYARLENGIELLCEHSNLSDTPPSAELTNALDWLMGMTCRN